MILSQGNVACAMLPKRLQLIVPHDVAQAISVSVSFLLLFSLFLPITLTNATPTIVQVMNATRVTTPTTTDGIGNADSAYFANSKSILLADGELIGATSLAAAAGAAAAIADTVSNDTPAATTGNNLPNNNSDIDTARSGDGEVGNRRELLANSANLLAMENFKLASTGSIINLTRHHDGDVFRAHSVYNCNPDTCVGLSSGTAGMLWTGQNGKDISIRSSSDVPLVAGGDVSNNVSHSQLDLLTRRLKGSTIKDSGKNDADETCHCRCLSYLSTYREDLGICVDDIHECSLSPFVSGSSLEKIPFVFLPLRGQIIYPSREILFPDIHTPVCAVTGAQYLTTNGWSELRNPIDTDYPFRMFRDEGRTFLQWLGESELRKKMQGRLIVVHLVCRDMTITLNTTSTDQIMTPKNVFSPCVAFRVNGSPVKYFHNVSEVLFQSEPTATLASTSDGMSAKEYIVIGVCSLLLGLIYVSSVFLYLHMKKRKIRDQSPTRNSLDDLVNDINYPKNDQVTFGAPFTRNGSLYSVGSLGNSNEPRSRGSIGSLKEEMGIVKNNPLLQHFPQLSEHQLGFPSDISNSNSECEMDGGYHDKLNPMQSSILIHPHLNSNGNSDNGSPKSGKLNSKSTNGVYDKIEPIDGLQENECLPQENVSIVEDIMTEEKMENLRALANGNVRRKLYFNPAYFEPHLLAQPPPAAIEFLQKIREVIAIAKYKMATKRFQPSLIMIPEEGGSISNSHINESQRFMVGECQACVHNRCSGHVKNCGEKRNSIEKWLQSVSITDQRGKNSNKETAHKLNGSSPNSRQKKNLCTISNQYSASKSNLQASDQSCRLNSSNLITTSGNALNSPRRDITSPKQRPPPPPAQQLQNNKNNILEQQFSNPKMNNTEVNGKHNISSQYVNNLPRGIQSQSVTIPINRTYDTFSALSAVTSIYGFAEPRSEIYNNPKFVLFESPTASPRSRCSSHRSKSCKKRLDVLDQYAAASTPTSLNSIDRQHYDMLRNMKQIPDPPYDSERHNFVLNCSFQLDIPTPDYDSTIEKKIKDIYNNTQSSGPSVPTPDYSTLSRKSIKQSQPDSPIYRRKSPQYLIVDYETDSLERLEATKRKSSHSSSSPSSDISSQMSPSLSTALPLEEEMEITHTVFEKADGIRQDSEMKKELAKTENGSSKQKEIAARIKYDTPFRGSMTIEVEHEPQSDLERSTDSDQFEPDTLDRKPKKQSFCDLNTWQNQLMISSANDNDVLQRDNLNSLPNIHNDQDEFLSNGAASFELRSSNSFRNQRTDIATYESHIQKQEPIRPKFGSLCNLYEPQLIPKDSQRSFKCKEIEASNENNETLSEKGRILTLEAKQKRRQRVMQQMTPPPIIEIKKITNNKTTIKISTPKVSRAATPVTHPTESACIEPQPHESPVLNNFLEVTKKLNQIAVNGNSSQQVPNSVAKIYSSKLPPLRKKRAHSPPPLPPPPPPIASTSTSLNNQKGCQSTRATQSSSNHFQSHIHPHYQNQSPYMQKSHSPSGEDETQSNHSVSTEITGISDTLGNSEFGGSYNSTLSTTVKRTNEFNEDCVKLNMKLESPCNSIKLDKRPEFIQATKKVNDYSTMFNTEINGLRNDYSLTKYLNRRKAHDMDEHQNVNIDAVSESESIKNGGANLKLMEVDANKLDVISISSRSNRSSSRLSDRTKEMYRNAGVPVGIAYPQRSLAASSNSSNTINATNVNSSTIETVYRCEIEPVQLTHGMQIAMGLKDRAKKAKDLKNAWKKFVSIATSKFSPTQSPAPPFEKKSTNFLDVLDRDEGISSLIDEHPQVSTLNSAPTSQNYYEQRFGGTRHQEMDSGYISADSGEVYKRSFYDRYNFKMMSGRDHIIKVDTIEDISDNGSTLTDRHNQGTPSIRRSTILDSNRFKDFEHMGEPSPDEEDKSAEFSDADSDRTLTQMDSHHRTGLENQASYSSEEDEHGNSTSYGSSETDGETNVEDMWESGAESIETHSVLYKNVRKS